MVGESTGVCIASKNPSYVSLECNQRVMWSHLLVVKHDFSKHFNLPTNYSMSNQREQGKVGGRTSDNNSNTHLLVWEVHWRYNEIVYGLNRRVVCKKATS